MLFSMLTAAAVVAPAAAARQGLTFRPQQSDSATIEHLAESLATTDRMTVIEEASSVVNNIMLQAGNATEHLEAAEKLLMEKVRSLVEDDMYASMGDSHSSDDQDLKDAIAKISACNADITARQSATGDLGLMHEDAIALQDELNRLQGIVDDKRRDNDTYWAEFDGHMRGISDPPPCPDFPEPRGMAALDIYFETSEYSAWWTAARKPYLEHKRRWEAADEALKQAISDYEIYKAKRDVKWCDMKTGLEAACASFDDCYGSSVDHYNALVSRAKSDMIHRLEVFKAGQDLIAEVKYLLDNSKGKETPDDGSSRFKLSFSAVPKKALCDVSTLTSDTWKPSISCESTDAGKPTK